MADRRKPLKIVSPDRILYVCADDKAAFDALMKGLGVGSKLLGNLRSLCGFAASASDAPNERGNWQLLQKVSWLKQDGDPEIIPVVGSIKHIFETVVQQHGRRAKPNLEM